ncbi:peptidoglycan-associated lipoprotein Pal [Rhodoferax sp.]|uniref:peptidoglycan-associated lipoprotein Pal n=1 Tax=Rhodoferax sp. TaxID=50421 RepID=UPI0026049EA8|nr:peptidoglycan-associated lipoprotein Pal [Rhodoferax sp.]MDD2926181.1 peptidoglycan-associated lipoprotein Pal [Rhodoferax sp.]
MKNLAWFLVVGVWLVGCGSTVPLSDVPVTDATAKPVTGAGGTEGTGSGVQPGGVTPVNLDGAGSAANAASAQRVIYFDFDSFVIKPEYQSLVAEQARLIKGQANRKVAVEGHADETGGREYNLALGQKRADAVVNALTILGVSKSQLEAVSFGKEKPAVAGHDESAYAKNRRAEIRY